MTFKKLRFAPYEIFQTLYRKIQALQRRKGERERESNLQFYRRYNHDKEAIATAQIHQMDHERPLRQFTLVIKAKRLFLQSRKKENEYCERGVWTRHGVFYIVNKAKHVFELTRAITCIFGSINPRARDGECDLLQGEKYRVRISFNTGGRSSENR